MSGRSAALPDAGVLPLASAFNLRDFGGLETADGRTVRRGVLFRSGTMSLLTPEDAKALRALGIRAICDLRRPNERLAEPTGWHGAEVDYYSRDYRETSGVLGEVLRSDDATADDMHAAMVAIYRAIPADHAESYRAMFKQILAGRLPILINCAAGKDRTGVGVMLILSALGVPRKAIVQDYLATNDHADWTWRLGQGETRLSVAFRERREMVMPLLLADSAYLDALYEALDAGHGGVDAYLRDGLGLDDDALSRLRGALIAP